MADRFPVGVSSFDDGSATSPHGQIQYVGTAAAAAQVRSLIAEFASTPFAADGDRLSVNEAIRERPRQKQLRDDWDAYLARGKQPPSASLAAVIYTSTHDPSRANALDFGITTADGRNRAMTAEEAQWVHDNGVRRGIRWTGRDFRPQESWHHNAGYPATVAPIPDAPVIGTITPGRDDDMPKLELRQDENGTIWLCRDRMERRTVANMQEAADLQYMISKLNQDAAITVGSVAGFGVDISVRKDEYRLVKDPKGDGTVFLSWRRVFRIPLTAADLPHYQNWLGKNGYYADVLGDSNLGAYGADIRTVNKIGA